MRREDTTGYLFEQEQLRKFAAAMRRTFGHYVLVYFSQDNQVRTAPQKIIDSFYRRARAIVDGENLATHGVFLGRVNHVTESYQLSVVVARTLGPPGLASRDYGMMLAVGDSGELVNFRVGAFSVFQSAMNYLYEKAKGSSEAVLQRELELLANFVSCYARGEITVQNSRTSDATRIRRLELAANGDFHKMATDAAEQAVIGKPNEENRELMEVVRACLVFRGISVEGWFKEAHDELMHKINGNRLPVVSINGTNPKALMDAYLETRHILHKAELSWNNHHVHGRDYQDGNPRTFDSALEWQQEQHKKLSDVISYLDAHIEHLAEHVK